MMGLEPTTFCMASRRSSQLSYIRRATEYSLGVGASAANLDGAATWRSGLRGGLQSPLRRFDSGRRLCGLT